MDQNFTFLSGLSSKRAKSNAKTLAKVNQSSLVHELNATALRECGMTWADAVQFFQNIPSPIINNRDVEDLVRKHSDFDITGKIRPAHHELTDTEIKEWQSHLFLLNLMCRYIEHSKFVKNNIEDPANITPMILRNYFDELHLSILPCVIASKLPDFKGVNDWNAVGNNYYSGIGLSGNLEGLMILAAIHMGYQYKNVKTEFIGVNLFKLNITLNDVQDKTFPERMQAGRSGFFKDIQNYATEVDALFKHTGLEHHYYPNCMSTIKEIAIEQINRKIQAKVTAKGLGVQIFGTEAQLRGIYDALHLLIEPNYADDEEESPEVMFLFQLCYDIRKAFHGQRDELHSKSGAEQIYGVKVLMPTIITQIHCLYRYLCNTHLSKDLKDHVQELVDAVLEALLDRSNDGYQGVVDWMERTGFLNDNFDFELLAIACNDYLTRFKTSKTRLKNLPLILHEMTANGSSKKSFDRKIEQAGQSIEKYFVETEAW